MTKSVSVVMATFNSGPILEKALKSVRNQIYDQEKIEIVVADGGSSDGTVEIIKKFGGRVISEKTGGPESAKAVALRHAKNEIVLEIDCDNILPTKNWLKTMVRVMETEPSITGCYTWRYRHNPRDKILNRYFALMGANDPVAFFLGRADRQSYLDDDWSLLGKVSDKGKYFLVEFDKNEIPTLGANGFLIKRRLLNQARVDEKHFFHIDVNCDLIKKGHRKYAVVKNDIIHDSGEGFVEFFLKRKRYMEDLYLRDLSRRRYLLYDKKKDQKKILAYVFYSLTLVLPTIFAVRGYLKRRDPAWFLHPIVCWLIMMIYALSVINWQTWNYLGILKRRLNR